MSKSVSHGETRVPSWEFQVVRRNAGSTYGLVFGGRGGDGALRTAVAGVGGVNDGDLVNAWCGGLGVGRSEDREEEGSDLGMHFGGVMY